MITAIPYSIGYSAIAVGLLAGGYRREAEGVATMVAGLLAMLPFVALTPLYPFAGLIIWRVVAMRLDKISEKCEFPRALPLLGYAMAASYMLYFLDLIVSVPDFFPRFWPTWVLNGMGLVMVALMLRRPACDLISFLDPRHPAGVGETGLRRMDGGRIDRDCAPRARRAAETEARP